MSDSRLEKPLNKMAIHGVPRSGTSWIGEIFNSSPNTLYRYQPIFSYALKDYLTPASTLEDIDRFFELLRETDDDFLTQSRKRISGKMPVFEKTTCTHIIYKEVRYINILPNLLRRSTGINLCCVIRNPLSVVNSWLLAPREFRKDLGWNELEEWRYALKKNLNKPEEFNGYEKWKEAALLFHRLQAQYPDRVHILNYADFIRDPVGRTRHIFESVGLDFTQSTYDFILKSGNTPDSDHYSVYRERQTDDKWKTTLDENIVSAILADLGGSELEIYINNA